jgi:hypothetical protein
MSKDITETYADGTIVERAFTNAELEQQAADIAWEKAKADAKAARTAAREALLDRLGITVDEAQLLLGGM